MIIISPKSISPLTKTALKSLAQLITWACIVLIASACSPFPTNNSSPVYKPVPAPQTKPKITPQKPRPKIIAPAKASAKPAEKAVNSLLKEAWKQYHMANFQRAISIAERAQRLDPRRAENYLLMASSYFALGQNTRAEQLAQRGLSLSLNEKVIRRRLQNLLAKIQRQNQY